MMDDAWSWIWGLVREWFTPTVLFLLLNLVIGTIAVTSGAHRHRDRHADGPAAAAAEGDTRHLSRASSSVLERLRSFGLYRFRSGDFPPDYTTTTTSSSSAAAAHAAEPGTDPITEDLSEAEAEERHHFGRSRSESRPQAQEAEAEEEGAGRMKKSASASSGFVKSEEGRVVRQRAAAAEEEEVNARADDFINRFRQQLKLQRLNSLLNYKEMLNRGP